jgi:3-methylcrotonyl-CoA carboxylase alpha subunit
LRDLEFEEGAEQGGGGLVRAPMHGKVLALLVAPGERVRRGQRLAIIEAMKMEHTLHAPVDGTVADIAVTQEAQVAEGAKVMIIAPAED